MKALFWTTQTNDCLNHVRAWESAFGSAIHYAFDHNGIRNDWQAVEVVRDNSPDILFYIGAYKARGNPRLGSFREIKRIIEPLGKILPLRSKRMPMINLVSDAADRPWHDQLRGLAQLGIFDLQVSIDGAKDAPVDFATMTPVDPRPFAPEAHKDIRCGFSGSVGRWNSRSETIKALEWFGGLHVRDRVHEAESYDAHVRFLKRCRMVLNLSFTGSGNAHHIKGRVLEAGWAGCALIESEGSPIAEWFPSDCYRTFRDPPHAKRLIETMTDAEIDHMASRLSHEVRTKYTPKMIYGEILNHVGLPIAKPAA